MKISQRLALAGLLAALSGCIIVTDRDDIEWDDGADSGSWRQQQEHNRDAIDRLELGSGIESVKAELGSPDFTESVARDDSQFLILRYRTQHRHSDGETTVDETTPLVFENGRLTGWGASAMKSHGL